MTIELPTFTGPAPARIGFVGVFQPKKAGKTTISTLVANQARDMGLEAMVFQHDRHDRLTPYATATRIELAKAQDLIGGDTSADLKAHEELAAAIESLPAQPSRLVILDSSGPGASLMAPVLEMARFDSFLADHGISALLLVPARPVLDVAEGALVMARELREAMPRHIVMPVIIATPNELSELSQSHPLRTLVAEASHGVIKMRSLSVKTASALESVLHPLSEIADPYGEAAITLIRNYTGFGRIEAGAVTSAAASLVTDFDRGLAPLGFTPGA
jgi:hypothetical protein